MKTVDNITLNRLLTTVASQGGSDLHLTIGAPPVLRKEGELIQLDNEEIVTANFLERVLENFLAEGDRLNLEKQNEIVLTQTFNKILRFRVNIYKQKGNFSVAFRYIPLCQKKISDLGLPSSLEKIVRFKNGLVVVAGIYDSGKSTTIAAILNTLNELGPPQYITTLERPIEHLFANNKCIIEQREVGKDVASYIQGLKLVSEEDIDRVVLDRLADSKSAKKFLTVLEAGRSGILTLEAASVFNVLNKIISYFEGSEVVWAQKVVSQRLLCIIAQKLVHKIGGGRVLAYEFLVNTGVVSAFISSLNISGISNILKTSKENDMISMEGSLAYLVQKGDVKLEEALAEANDKEYVKSLLR